jgi:hypothetical protein
MSQFALSREELGSQFVVVGYVSVPVNTKHMRAFAIESDNATSIRSFNVPKGNTNSGTFTIDQLLNGTKYDVQLVAYSEGYSSILGTASLGNIIPAGVPAQPTINGRKFLEGKALTIDVNVGAYSGDAPTKFSVTIFDDANDAFTTVLVDGILSSNGDVKTIDLSGLYNFEDQKTYSLCAAAINKIGVSDNSPMFTFVYKNLPDQAVNAVITHLAPTQTYQLTWNNGDDAEQFSNLKYSVALWVKYTENNQEKHAKYSIEDILYDAEPATYVTPPAPNEVRDKYTGSNTLLKAITPEELAGRFSQLNISHIRKFSMYAKVVTVSGHLESLPVISTEKKSMNVFSLKNTVTQLAVLSATGSRNPTKVTFNVSLSAQNIIALGQVAAGIFNKVKFYCTLKQKDSMNADVFTSNSKEMLISASSDSVEITPPNGIPFSSADRLGVRYSFINNDYESPLFDAADRRPIIPSVASNVSAAECRLGKIYFQFDLENGSSDSRKASIISKAANSNASAVTTTDLMLVAVAGEPGKYYVETQVPNSIANGAEVDVQLKLFDVVAGFPDASFYSSSAPGDRIVNLNENYANILADVQLVHADIEPDPQKSNKFYIMLGFKKSTMAVAQGSNRDNADLDADPSEIQLDFSVSNVVGFALNPLSNTYIRHSEANELDKLPVQLNIAVGTQGLTGVALADDAKLTKVLAIYGFLGAKEDYFWVEASKSNMAANVNYTMNLLARRVISGKEFSTLRSIAFKLRDAVSINRDSVEYTKRGIAFQLDLLGETVDLLVQGIPVQGSDNSNVSSIPTIRQTVLAADLDEDGYIALKFADSAPEMAAYLVAIATNTRGNSLDVAVIQADNAPDFTEHLPAPPVVPNVSGP